LSSQDITEQEKLAQACDIVIGAMGQAFALYGLADVMGRIYGLLYFAEVPMGLDDIAAKLGVSKATISINARVLEEFKFLRKVWQKGDRRDFYEAQRNFTKAFMEVMQNNLKKELDITQTAISKSQSILDTVADSRNEAIRRQVSLCNERLRELDNQYRLYGRLASILGMGEKLWKTITFQKD
jgi:DNA-binding transcriptional regulator GbsR (MarR family)